MLYYSEILMQHRSAWRRICFSFLHSGNGRFFVETGLRESAEQIANMYGATASYLSLFKLAVDNRETLRHIGLHSFVLSSSQDANSGYMSFTPNILNHGVHMFTTVHNGVKQELPMIHEFAGLRELAREICGKTPRKFLSIGESHKSAVTPNVLMLNERITGEPIQDRLQAFFDACHLPVSGEKDREGAVNLPDVTLNLEGLYREKTRVLYTHEGRTIALVVEEVVKLGGSEFALGVVSPLLPTANTTYWLSITVLPMQLSGIAADVSTFPGDYTIEQAIGCCDFSIVELFPHLFDI